MTKQLLIRFSFGVVIALVSFTAVSAMSDFYIGQIWYRFFTEMLCLIVVVIFDACRGGFFIGKKHWFLVSAVLGTILVEFVARELASIMAASM